MILQIIVIIFFLAAPIHLTLNRKNIPDKWNGKAVFMLIAYIHWMLLAMFFLSAVSVSS